MSLALVPMIILVFGILAVILADLISPKATASRVIAQLTVVAALLCQLASISVVGNKAVVWKYIARVLAFDPLSMVFSSLALFMAFLVIGVSKNSFEEEESNAAEYYSLMLTAVLGGVLVAHSKELLTFFLAFEMLSIPLYILAGFRRYNAKSAEAGLKYFLSGALSSAIFLFGASWIFGASGSTVYSEILNGVVQHKQALFIGVLFVVAAFAFKMSAAPFHMWAPDTYEGSPIPVAAMLSTFPKVCMFAASIRLFLALTDKFGQELMLIFAALAILSVVMGNLVALTQTELTRLAAYSGVAQIGYLLIGLSSLIGMETIGRHDLAHDALGSLFFYLLIYTVTNIAFWVILLTVSKARNKTTLDAFNGLSQSAPFLSFCLMIAIFSLAGIPPLAGFVGKLFLFRGAFYTQPLMAFFGVLGSVISLYYYFNILRRCYFMDPPENAETLAIPGTTKILLSLLLFLTLIGGLYPGVVQGCYGLAELALLGLP